MTSDELRDMTLRLTGATAAGVLRVRPVDDEAVTQYNQWIAEGCHGDMAYLELYDDVRRDPRLLLDGARAMIMAAFSYANPHVETRPHIAEYALGADYHEEVRRRLGCLAEALTDEYGGATRVCVDTAPLRERYWAERAGLGWIGLNNQLIVPGHGAHIFIGTLLWTGAFEGDEDRPLEGDCGRCGACVRACPAGALDGNGGMDARRCLSYLTIESRATLSEGFSTHGCLYGCDACRLACPHENRAETTDIEAFIARPELVGMSEADWTRLTPGDFKRLTRHSAMNRVRLAKLLDTLRHL